LRERVFDFTQRDSSSEEPRVVDGVGHVAAARIMWWLLVVISLFCVLVESPKSAFQAHAKANDEACAASLELSREVTRGS